MAVYMSVYEYMDWHNGTYNKKYSIIHLIQSRAYNQSQAKLITNVVR